MKTRTRNDQLSAALFGFISMALICSAALIAATSLTRAQEQGTFWPTPNGYSTTNHGGNTPAMTSWENGVFQNNKNGIASNPSSNSAVWNGVPSTMPSSPSNNTTTLSTSRTLRK